MPFQLRNLVWAASPHDVYVMHHYTVNHWSPLSKKPTQVLNLTGPVQVTNPTPTPPHSIDSIGR